MRRKTPLKVLTHTSRARFRRCRYEYHLRDNLHILPRTEKKALRFGGNLHAALHILKQGGSYAACVDYVTGRYRFLQEQHTDERALDLEYERTQVVCLAAGWLWRWANDPLTPIASEFMFELPIRRPGAKAAMNTCRNYGVIDWIVALPDGRRAIVEHKTTSSSLDLDGDYWKTIPLLRQPAEYLAGAREAGFSVDVVLWDVIRKPEIRPKKVPVRDDEGCKIVLDDDGARVFLKNGKPRQTADHSLGWHMQATVETPEEYGERLMADIYERPDWYYGREEIIRTDDEVERCLEEMWQQATEMRRCENAKHWYRNTDSCVTHYGACEYLPICESRIDVQSLPEAYTISDPHPELSEDSHENVPRIAHDESGAGWPSAWRPYLGAPRSQVSGESAGDDVAGAVQSPAGAGHPEEEW